MLSPGTWHLGEGRDVEGEGLGDGEGAAVWSPAGCEANAQGLVARHLAIKKEGGPT